jgi:hypothetical protein
MLSESLLSQLNQESVYIEMNLRKIGGFLQSRAIPMILRISRTNMVVFLELTRVILVSVQLSKVMGI